MSSVVNRVGDFSDPYSAFDKERNNKSSTFQAEICDCPARDTTLQHTIPKVFPRKHYLLTTVPMINH